MTVSLPRRVQLKRLASCTLGKMVQSSGAEGHVLAPYLRAAHVQPSGRVIELPDQRMWFSSAELKTLTLRRGDVVVVEGGAGYGRSAVLDKDLDGWGFQNSIVRVRPKSGLADARFIDYAIQAALLSGEIESFVSTATIPHFTAEKVARLPIVDIHAANQRAISDFLDRETAQIDAFIAKNEELIALLTERRTATITRCVTSGLSGSAGLQEGHWTASVPGHWQVMPLRYAIGKIDQGVSPQAEAGLAVDAGQVGVLKSGCANGGVFLPLEHKVLPSDFVFDPAIQINVGDLLVNRASGSVSLLGSAAIVTENPYQLILSDKTFRIWPSGRTSRHYLYWLLNSRLYREQVEATVSGAEGLANNLPMSRLRSFSLPFPPLAEQRKLIVFLERETSAISQAILIASRGIDLARERRAALISAAVTGKIDVGVSA